MLHEDLGATLGPERFLAEIKTTAKLQHPHVLPLLDSGSTAAVGETGGLLYYVMPFVEGESLRDRLDRDKQLPIEDAVRIAREIADALGFAHANGIVHRDIKPENILLQGGHALVADFGIALAVQHAGGARMTQTGLSLGTPQYMSPEQAMGEKVVDARADIYALGAVTYEMLVGEPPFTGTTVQAIVAKVLSSEPEPPTTMRKTIPAHVEQAVLIALAKLPADRFGSAAEFATALSGGTARTIAIARRSRSGPRRPLLQWAAVVVLLVGAWMAGRLTGSTNPVAATAPPIRFTLPSELARNAPCRLIAVATDGSRFVFQQQLGRGGESRLAMVRLDRAGVEPVPGSESASDPFFSRDGEWLAFRQGGRLKKLRLDGSPAVTLGDDVASSINTQIGGAWGRDGSMLIATRAGGLVRVPDAGGEPQKIPLPDGIWYSAPVWLHDDNHIVLAREKPGGGGGADREMVVYTLDDARLVGTLGKGFPMPFVRIGPVSLPQYAAARSKPDSGRVPPLDTKRIAEMA